MTQDVQRHLPLKAVDFHVLLVLAEGPLHGYGIVKAIEARSEGRVRLQPGNLYRYLRRLVDEGMVEPDVLRVADDAAGERRRDYRVTPYGRRVLAADASRLRALVAAAEASVGPGA